MMKKERKKFIVRKNTKKISPKKAKIIDRAVKKAVTDYKWTFKHLGST